jgi:hypothetical protein
MHATGLIRLKEGAAGAAVDESSGEPCDREGKRDRSQTLHAQASDKKKWRYNCRLFWANSLKDRAM